MSIETRFDVPLISALALREKAIQQNYRPIIAVHKWFARRPGTLFRGLLLSEFVDADLRESFFQSNRLDGKRIADPFMGGGTPLIEANRLGADVVGWDINPMAWWIVGRELEHLDLHAYQVAGEALLDRLQSKIGKSYQTECTICEGTVPVKYFLWVKRQSCRCCHKDIDLFPGFVVATDSRHPGFVLVCAKCGELNEAEDRNSPGSCSCCGTRLHAAGPARRSSVDCPGCGAANSFPAIDDGPLDHRMFAIEYHCPSCKSGRKGRFFKKPSQRDLDRYDEAAELWERMVPEYVPDDVIPPGDETNRLHRWGYDRYRQMFNSRQLLGLEISCGLVASDSDTRVRGALATNLSDLLRYNNLLVRYDTVSLKALDLFSVHGFPVGLVRCESNLLGIRGANGRPIGSGGWVNILAKYLTAKDFCGKPFEVPLGSRARAYTSKEWIGDHSRDNGRHPRVVDLRCESATGAKLKAGSLDAVFTDPPYYDSVQYAELMDFCYVWLRRLVGTGTGGFESASTRNRNELTGNETEGRDMAHFAKGLATVFSRLALALRRGGPFVFTYHHNRAAAYHPVAVAILDAGLVATATIPCPAEMGGSIHISGTTSSIIDTVFVCRSQGEVATDEQTLGREDVARLVSVDLAKLRAGGVKPTRGDTRCIALGHTTRIAVWMLRDGWNRDMSTDEKLAKVARAMTDIACIDDVVEHSRTGKTPAASGVQTRLFEERRGDQVSRSTRDSPVVSIGASERIRGSGSGTRLFRRPGFER